MIQGAFIMNAQLRSLLVLILAAELGFANSASADSEPVEFDAKLSVSAKDVTPVEFAKANAGLRTFEVRLPISANIRVDEALVEHLIHKVRVPKPLEVVDFLPRTELGSEMAGPYEVGVGTKERRARVTSIDGGAQVGYKVLGVGLDAQTSASRKDELMGEASSDVQFHVLPPKKSIVAAGTEDRGRTVYFELRPYSQATLKGQREFVLLIVAPEDWDGVCIDINCSATTRNPPVTTSTTIRTAVYRAGNMEARRKYEAIAESSNTELRVESKPTSESKTTQNVLPMPNLVTLAKYYRLFRKPRNKFIDSLTFAQDGTWKGWHKTEGEDSKVLSRGTWSLDEGKLTIIETDCSTLGIGPWIRSQHIIIDNEPIVSWKVGTTTVRLKSGSWIDVMP